MKVILNNEEIEVYITANQRKMVYKRFNELQKEESKKKLIEHIKWVAREYNDSNRESKVFKHIQSYMDRLKQQERGSCRRKTKNGDFYYE